MKFLNHVVSVNDLQSDTQRCHQTTCTTLSQLLGAPAAHKRPSVSERCLGNQAVWEMEVLMEREAQAALAESPGKASGRVVENEAGSVMERADGPRTLGKAEGGGGLAKSYECMVVAAPLTDSQAREDEDGGAGEDVEEGEDVTGTPLAAAPAQDELYGTQDLQTVMSGCELADQRSTLGGSQVGRETRLLWDEIFNDVF